MRERGSETWWCWFGLIVAGGLGLLLAEAGDLFSMTEGMADFDLGPWMTLSEFGLEDVNWSFRITPRASWWGIACGGLAILMGWQAAASGDLMPFGVLGGFSWLSLAILLFADNLLVATLGWCGQGLILGAWLGWQARTQVAAAGVKQYLITLLVSDTLWLTGVLLVGLSWGSFEFADLTSPEFIQKGWQIRPALCGFATTCLGLGLLCHGWLFPFSVGLRGVSAFSGPANAWVFGVCGVSITWWMFLQAWPLMSGSQETVTLVQGLALLGAVVMAFLAIGQTDPRRAIGSLGSAQFAILMSAAIVPELVEQNVLAWGVWALSIATVMLFLGVKTNPAHEARHALSKRLSMGLALLIMTGACPTPAFWIVIEALEAGGKSISLAQASQEINELDSVAAAGAEMSEKTSISTPSQPMPISTWCAAWCLWSFFSAFAAWRVWRLNSAAETASTSAVRVGLTISMLTCCAGAIAGRWHGAGDWSAVVPWPVWYGLAASLSGWLLSAWVCRNAQSADERFQQLGSWTRLSRREFYLDEAVRYGIDVPARNLGQLAASVDGLLTRLGRHVPGGMLQAVVNSVEELRNQRASFYAGALLLTIGSLLLTWLSLIG